MRAKASRAWTGRPRPLLEGYSGGASQRIQGEAYRHLMGFTHPTRLAENAAAAELQLSADDLQAIDNAYPAPTRKQRLQMV